MCYLDSGLGTILSWISVVSIWWNYVLEDKDAKVWSLHWRRMENKNNSSSIIKTKNGNLISTWNWMLRENCEETEA